MEIIYSSKPISGIGKAKSRRIINPSFFHRPERDAKDVFVNGDHPKIASAYKAGGITVKPLSDHPSRKSTPSVKSDD